MMNHKLGWCLLLASCSCWADSPTQKSEPIDNAQRVETSLLPSYRFYGEEKIYHTLPDRMDFYEIQGVSIAVIDQGKIDWSKGYGVTKFGEEAKVTNETVFQAGSISKSVAAMVALAMADQKKIDLEAPIAKSMKGWGQDLDPEITYQTLFTHLAGINNPSYPGYAKGEAIPNLAQVIAGKGNTPKVKATSKPNRGWSYSGGGYVVAQKALEDSQGKPFEDLADEYLLAPLGMKHSTYDQHYIRNRFDSIAYGHTSTTPIDGGWHVYPELAAAGLWTTPHDIASLLVGLQDSLQGKKGSLLSQDSANKVITPYYTKMGFGLFLEQSDRYRYLYHSGETAGYESMFVFYPDLGKGAVVMTNGYGGEKLAKEVLRGIATLYKWPMFVEKPRYYRVTDELKMPDFAGTYKYNDGRKAELIVEGTQLFYKPENYYRVPLFLDEKGLFKPEDLPWKWDFKRNRQGKVTGFSECGPYQCEKAKRVTQ